MHISVQTLVSCLLPATALVIRRACNEFGGPPPRISNSGDRLRPYAVDGATFTDMGTAMQRTCDIQMNKCFNDANSRNGGFSPSDCSKQYQSCEAQKTQPSTVAAGNNSTPLVPATSIPVSSLGGQASTTTTPPFPMGTGSGSGSSSGSGSGSGNGNPPFPMGTGPSTSNALFPMATGSTPPFPASGSGFGAFPTAGTLISTGGINFNTPPAPSSSATINHNTPRPLYPTTPLCDVFINGSTSRCGAGSTPGPTAAVRSTSVFASASVTASALGNRPSASRVPVAGCKNRKLGKRDSIFAEQELDH